MNNPVRRFLQRRLEFPALKWLGLNEENQDILEVGCGSGYGAVLLSRLKPKSYVGVDLMPEMIDLAKKQPGLENAEFLVMDASDMSPFPNESKDIVVIFDILHHIPKWREVIRESCRVLRVGGKMFLEEPSAAAVKLWDRIFRWNHPEEALFSRRELEAHLSEVGLTIKSALRMFPFGVYCLQKE